MEFENNKNNENTKNSLIWFKDLLNKFTYTIESVGIERTNDIRNRIFDKLNISNEDCLAGKEQIKNYLNSIARGNSFIDELDSKLINAIEAYVGSAFEEINASLRENKGLAQGENKEISYTLDNSDSKKAKLEGLIEALDNAINKTELTKEIIVYRGGGINKFKDLNITRPEELILAIGKRFVEHGYSSTSTDFEGHWCETSPVVMVNKVLPGTHICGFGFSKHGLSSSEILIERDVEYTIVDVEIIDNKVFVYTEVKKTELIKEIKNVDNIDLEIKEEKTKTNTEYFYDENYYDFDVPEDYDEDMLEEKINNKKR